MKGVSAFGLGRRDEVSVSRFSLDGAFIGVIARAESIHRDAEGAGLLPLSPIAWFSTAGNALYVGETLTPRIRIVDGEGDVIREITWEPNQVSPDDALREVIGLAVQDASPDDERRVRARLQAAPLPDRVPAFSIFLVDDLGFVWVKPYEVERHAAALGGFAPERMAGGMWRIFTPGGEQVGTVEVPDGLEPHQVTRDAMIGIRRDELGVEYVQMHRLHRRTTSG